MTILYRLHEVLHRLLKKRQQKYTAIWGEKNAQNESKIWGSENLVSFTLLGGVSVGGLIIPFVIVLEVFIFVIILIFI